MLSWLLTCALLSLTSGCEGEEASSTADATSQTDAHPLNLDAGEDGGPADGGPGGDAAHADAEQSDGAIADGALADATPDGELPDEGLADAGPPVMTCQAACDRYSDCNRLVSTFGDEATCMARCGRLEAEARTGAWFACLTEERCEDLGICPPPRPRPLACGPLCARIEICGGPLEFDDCEAACEAVEGQDFLRCGELVAEGCDVNGLIACLGESAVPQCQTFCDRERVCEDQGLRCLASCIQDATATDPLVRQRADEAHRCVNLLPEAAICDQVVECVTPPFYDESLSPHSPARFCALWEQCELDRFLPCREFINVFVEEIGPWLVPCAIQELEGRCPLDPFGVLEPCQEAGPFLPLIGQACNDLCGARSICGQIDQPVFECVLSCNSADLEHRRRQEGLLPCINEANCPDLEACIMDRGPEGQCATICDIQAGCGPLEGGREACIADCVESFPLARTQAFRDCVIEAQDNCAAINQCTIPEGIDCAARCARSAEACNVEVEMGCLLRCDDEHFADPERGLDVLACALSAPTCQRIPNNAGSAHNVRDCLDDPAFGRDCLNYCRAASTCEGIPPQVSWLSV